MKECTQCGVCCTNKLDFKWIEVSAEEAPLIPPEMLQEGDILPFAMKQYADGQCVAFEGEVNRQCKCKIYKQRPNICNLVTQGDSVCLYMLGLHKTSSANPGIR